MDFPCAERGRHASPAFRAFLRDGLAVLGLELDAGQVELLDLFRRLLAEAGRTHNLTALRTDYEVATKHVIDSLTCLLTGLFEAGGRLADVGSGAGFPGLILKIARPSLAVTLIDSARKKTAFLSRAVDRLGLDRVTVLTERAEALGRLPEHRGRYDLAVARAVSGLAVDLEYAVPLLAPGGHFVAMKGPRVVEELARGERAAEVLGAELTEVLDLVLPLAGERRALVVFRKVRETPEAYPRRPGVPAKRPLS